MITKEQLKSINWKQPKYVIPAIIYLPILATAYFVIDLFYTKPAEAPDNTLQSTEYLNPELPQAQLNSDGIDSKYDSMVKSYGQIQDFSAVENIDRDDDYVEKEEYDSKYTDDDIALLDQEAAARADDLARMAEMQERLRQSANRGNDMTTDQQTLTDLQRALAEARLAAQKPKSSQETESTVLQEGVGEGPVAVVKKVQTKSDYFNTLTDNEADQKLIKAIIDENITAVDGSRVRLRLLDDVEINDVILYKGTYIYATMSGFGSQRVKGRIESLMVEDDIVKVNLSIYDTDGLEGLYVPSSSFRDTGKDIASGVMSNTATINSGTYANNFAQWGMQAVQNAYQQASSAISKAVKKNRAKLKYGTFVYLINSNSK